MYSIIVLLSWFTGYFILFFHETISEYNRNKNALAIYKKSQFVKWYNIALHASQNCISIFVMINITTIKLLY